MHHDHLLARGGTIVGSLALGFYTIRLLLRHAHTTLYDESWTSRLVGIVIVCVMIYLIVIACRSRYVPSNRRALAVIGLALIVLAEMTLRDDPTQHIYLRDFLKIVGALLVITGPMKLLVTRAGEQEKIMQDAEIIEV